MFRRPLGILSTLPEVRILRYTADETSVERNDPQKRPIILGNFSELVPKRFRVQGLGFEVCRRGELLQDVRFGSF